MPPSAASQAFAERALARHKREGLVLAVRARWAAMAVIAAMLPFLNFSPGVLFYLGLVAIFAGLGWVHLRIGTVGQSGPEFALMIADLSLITIAALAPNPLSDHEWPLEVQYRYSNFIYFFIPLAVGALAYSWRTMIAMGTWTALLWVVGMTLIWWFAPPYTALTQASAEAYADYPYLGQMMSPTALNVDFRVQEIVVFIIVAVTLAVVVRRDRQLLLSHAGLERERANLSRYFSPNVVEELSHNDEPLKQIRTQNVAVLFVDIVGFTTFAAQRTPEQVIDVLRDFHGRMGDAVFAHGGTLDKYLGDGLMATFGTPTPGPADAKAALDCVRAMMASVDDWNARRMARGEPEIRVSFGLHYGAAVLGDIGAGRLEFAVIGNTVNVASRLEALTRPLGTHLVASGDLIAEAQAEGADLTGITEAAAQPVRGLTDPIPVWTLA